MYVILLHALKDYARMLEESSSCDRLPQLLVDQLQPNECKQVIPNSWNTANFVFLEFPCFVWCPQLSILTIYAVRIINRKVRVTISRSYRCSPSSLLTSTQNFSFFFVSCSLYTNRELLISYNVHLWSQFHRKYQVYGLKLFKFAYEI